MSARRSDARRGLLLLVLLAAACDRADHRPGGPAVSSAPVAAPAAAVESIGVVECDEYLARYECMMASMGVNTKRPGGGVAQMRTTYKATAGTEAGRAALAQQCGASLATIKRNPDAAQCAPPGSR